MLRKLTAATAIAGVALGAVLAASPASASGGQQFNQNLQLVPIQLCNVDLAVGVGAVNIPILSPQFAGDCVNGPLGTNVNHDHHKGEDDNGHGY
ncbi:MULTISPECIES: hypothetical protein [unclassified Nocardiopsis]|uniref:hypothetical protein n=1 Tax=unclassified Nocardiopsis TaxID=2649073 RepID=UPI0013589AB0|nr:MULTISPECIES: hypothetical protein [unclassified Nocardiopsis]